LTKLCDAFVQTVSLAWASFPLPVVLFNGLPSFLVQVMMVMMMMVTIDTGDEDKDGDDGEAVGSG
jgi:hypothetical protein